MAFYRLSKSKIKRVLKFPKRTEKGIVPETIASMQPAGSKKHPYEIWVMYQIKSQNSNPKSKNSKQIKKRKIIIISAWKYPGVSKRGEPIPVPQDILEEILISYT
ncbi:MAG: hypothetical protein ACP5OX_00550 [Minisyncoccia bacterium]